MSEGDGSNEGGGMPLDLSGLLNKAREVKERMETAQETAAQIRVEGNAGGGMVVAEANGNGQILRISIEQSLFEGGDKEMIEDLTVAAANQAINKGKAAMQDELSKVTGGIPMPFDISKIF